MLVRFRSSGIVHGLNEYPPEDRPPVVLPFTAFHVMVSLGMLFILVTAFGTYRLRGGKLYGDTWFLRLLILAIPLPVIASEAGWIVAEVGRQPWIVYHLLRTKDAVSASVSAGEILFSLILFLVIYTLLFALYIYLISRAVKEAATDSKAMTSELQSDPKSKI
jgi:cytochrome d ubiquinol oxidase subunit I